MNTSIKIITTPLLLLHLLATLTDSYCYYGYRLNDLDIISDVTGALSKEELLTLPEVETALKSSQWCQGVRWVGLNLSHHNLSVLSKNLFDVSCGPKVVSLDLSFNQLHVLPQGLFEPLTNLLRLDLAFNRLRQFEPGMLPVNLLTLNVSHNGLTSVPSGLFNHTRCLQHIRMAHNQIESIQPEVFPSEMRTVRMADFSYNRLTVFQPWPYYFHTNVRVDLSHNIISSFANSVNFTMTKEFNLAVVNLTYNNITSITPHDFSIYHGGRVPSTFQIRNHWYFLDHNPWVCDCLLQPLVDILRQGFLKQWAFDGQFFTCTSPPSLSGRSLDFLLHHPYVLVCEVTKGCPDGCTCMDTPHHRYLAVSCDPGRHNYTHLPQEMPRDDLLSLNLSGHALRELKVDRCDVISCDVSRLQMLDVSDNQVQHVTAEFLDVASSLRVLNLKNNRLTSLPFNLQRLSLDKLHLSGNPLLCTCHLVWFGNWINAVVANWTSSRMDSTTRPSSSPMTTHWLENPEIVSGKKVLQSPSDPFSEAKALMCKLSDGSQAALTDTSQWGRGCESHVTLHVLLGGGTMLFVLLVMMGVCWRWRYNVRVLLHYYKPGICFCCGTVDNEARDDEARDRHDVYVSLDERDVKGVTWVENWLRPLLENRGDNSQRVYLPCTQELPGEITAESRASAIQESRKVLVLLSKNYVTGRWCCYEFDQACHHLQPHSHQNIVIVVTDYDDTDLQLRHPDHDVSLLWKTCCLAGRRKLKKDDIEAAQQGVSRQCEKELLAVNDVNVQTTRLVNDNNRAERKKQAAVDKPVAYHRCDEGVAIADDLNTTQAQEDLTTQRNNLCQRDKEMTTDDDVSLTLTCCSAVGCKEKRKEHAAVGRRAVYEHGGEEFAPTELLKEFLANGYYLKMSDVFFKQKLIYELDRRHKKVVAV